MILVSKVGIEEENPAMETEGFPRGMKKSGCSILCPEYQHLETKAGGLP